MFKVSIDQSSIKNVEDNIRAAFDRVIRNQQLLKEIGETIVVDIKGQNRSGKSPKTSTKHPGLAQSTIKHKKYLSKNNKTHGAFSPGKSNVTVTGELIEAIEFKPTGPGELIIKADGDHSPYKGNKGQAISDSIANEKLISYLKDKGFLIMGVRDSLIPRLRRIVIAYIRRASNTLFRLEND